MAGTGRPGARGAASVVRVGAHAPPLLELPPACRRCRGGLGLRLLGGPGPSGLLGPEGGALSRWLARG